MTAVAFDGAAHLLGESRVMCELRALVHRIAPTTLAVLVYGPTGAGKELVAQALHTLSGRDGRFVPVNVAAVPDAMFEDEFFGHVRGAFTGAIRDHAGLLIEAHRGTLFLDEVSSFSAATQPKLLRVLETRIFRRVGGRVDQRSEFRTVAATNEDLDYLIGAQRFRRDLRRRLAECVLRVPALVERRDDIALLAWHFARRVADPREVRITPEAVRVLEAYDWPDNVRELRQVVECGLALGNGVELTASDVLASLGDRPASAAAALADHAVGRGQLLQILEDCDWDTAGAAARLGINRSTVYRRMLRFGVTPPKTSTRASAVVTNGRPEPAFARMDANSRGADANDANTPGGA